GIIEGSETPNFIKSPCTVQGVEIVSVTRGQLGRLQITRPEVTIAKCFRALPCEEMKAEPTAVGASNALGFSKEGNEQKKNKIGIDMHLELKIAGKIFRCDLT